MISAYPSARSLREDVEQRVDLVRSEHAGRLVEDQDAGAGEASILRSRPAGARRSRGPARSSGSTAEPVRAEASATFAVIARAVEADALVGE